MAGHVGSAQCQIEGCDGALYGRGLCGLHYQRWRKHGDPLRTFKKVGRSICTVEDCGRPIVGRGMCAKHYRKPERQCSVEGCERLQWGGGLCDAHGQRLRKHGDVQAHIPIQGKTVRGSRRCRVEGCERLNHYGELCLAHYMRFRKNGDVAAATPIALREPGRLCLVEGCGRPHKAKGYCTPHFRRVQATGDAQPGLPIFKKLAAEWIRDHLSYAGDDCLTWPFARIAGGPGSVTGSVVGRKGTTMPASRAMCILAHGEPPTPRHVAAHNCGKGHEACVNPRHLRWATMKENAADTLKHGTRPVLVHSKSNRLTAAQLKAVRLLADQMSAEELAITFRVDLHAIQRALKVTI